MKRRWILWIFTIAFIWVVVTRFTQIQKLAETIAAGRWNWVLAAAGLQLIYFVLLTGIYFICFQTVDVHTRLLRLLPITFSSFFVNLVAPAGGAAGNALFVDDAARRGQSSARAAAGVLLFMITDFLGFTFLLVAGLIILFRQHTLKFYEVGASLFLIIFTVTLAGLLLLGLWQPDLQERLLFWVQRRVNGLAARFKRPNLLPIEWAEKTAEEFNGAAQAISAKPRQLAAGLAVSVTSHLVNIACIYCLFRAFYQPVGVSVLVAGYAIGILFWIVSITPQGVGVVEGLMALTFTTLDVPANPSTVIALTYRGLNVWIPVIIGFVLIHRLRSFRPRKKAKPSS